MVCGKPDIGARQRSQVLTWLVVSGVVRVGQRLGKATITICCEFAQESRQVAKTIPWGRMRYPCCLPAARKGRA